jgi:hypothetical protein
MIEQSTTYLPPILINVLSIFFGASFGLVIADIDQNAPFMKHRSAITHGPLLALWLWYQPAITGPLLWFLAGFLPAYSVHLIFDMHPKEWAGIAKIHFFWKYRLWGPFSFLWLAAGAIGTALMTVNMVNWQFTVIMLFASFVYKRKSEKSRIAPTVTVIVVLFVVVGYGLDLLYKFLQFLVIR